MKYKNDYKTNDNAWIEPTRQALTGTDVVVRFKKLNPNARIPEYKSEQAAGMDICSIETVDVLPRKVVVVSTGLAMSIPKGFEAQVRSRSGLAAKHGVAVLNSPGTIDSDYRGEIKVILMNHGDGYFKVEPGDRIAQLVIAPVVQSKVVEVDNLDETDRGEGGFGSTGVK